MIVRTHPRQFIIFDLLCIDAVVPIFQNRIPEALYFFMTNKSVRMGAHHSIPVDTTMWHALGIQHGMWKPTIPLEHRQCARISPAGRRVAQPVEAVVDMHHLMHVFVCRHVGEVVLSPAPLPQHLDTVELVEDAEPGEVAPIRQGYGGLVVCCEFVFGNPHTHIVQEGVPGCVTLRSRLACIGTVDKIVVEAELVPHGQASEGCDGTFYEYGIKELGYCGRLVDVLNGYSP